MIRWASYPHSLNLSVEETDRTRFNRNERTVKYDIRLTIKQHKVNDALHL